MLLLAPTVDGREAAEIRKALDQRGQGARQRLRLVEQARGNRAAGKPIEARKSQRGGIERSATYSARPERVQSPPTRSTSCTVTP